MADFTTDLAQLRNLKKNWKTVKVSWKRLCAG